MDATSVNTGLSEYYDQLLKGVYEKEKQNPLASLKSEYTTEKKAFGEGVEEYDVSYNNLIRLMNMNPDK